MGASLAQAGHPKQLKTPISTGASAGPLEGDSERSVSWAKTEAEKIRLKTKVNTRRNLIIVFLRILSGILPILL